MPKVSKKAKKQIKLENELINKNQVDDTSISLAKTFHGLEDRPKNELKITFNNKPKIFINYANKILQDKEYKNLVLIGEGLNIPKVLQIGNKLKHSFNVNQVIKVENLGNTTDSKLCPRITFELIKLD